MTYLFVKKCIICEFLIKLADCRQIYAFEMYFFLLYVLIFKIIPQDRLDLRSSWIKSSSTRKYFCRPCWMHCILFFISLWILYHWMGPIIDISIIFMPKAFNLINNIRIWRNFSRKTFFTIA